MSRLLTAGDFGDRGPEDNSALWPIQTYPGLLGMGHKANCQTVYLRAALRLAACG